MTLSRREFLRNAAIAGAALPTLGCGVWRGARPTPRRVFAPSWSSLAQYEVPDWFRDAKFGIWAHWGPQCQPERGDWYARRMYIQGEWQYDHHLKTYGHPSRTGFMDIISQWKAERWDPEALMELYVRAGAKYFVSMANHHDNFDNFDSTHHAWNAVRVGPRQDIVGRWEKIARRHGLRFGVSNHSAHAWHWYQPAYDYDPEGPLAGVRYDAYRLTTSDGAGKWWDGLDPQQLYTGRHIVMPDGFTSAKAAQDWHWAHDGVWTEDPPPDDPAYATHWLARCNDLVDKYRPDLLYFDDTELPLGSAGLAATAHFYNASMEWNGGRLEAVVTGKKLEPPHRGAIVEDVERGFSETLQPLPWHADTCIGDWHYDRAIYEEHRYKSADSVVQRLCDTVSKNGCLLLNIPVKGDGTIDTDEVGILERVGDWTARNGEAIYATRPWKIFGEGPTNVAGGMMAEDKTKPFTAEDIRFTRRGDVLYALVMARPSSDTVRITSLAAGSPHAPGAIDHVRLLGGSTPLNIARDGTALSVQLPASRPDEPVLALKIDGRGLV